MVSDQQATSRFRGENAEDDIRQLLSDVMIREINEEIDRDTLRRFGLGQRIVQTEHGPVWTYFVDANNKVVDESGILLDNDGNSTGQRGTFNSGV